MGTLVLTATKEPNEYFASADSTVEEICVGHMCAFKGIKERMDEIKEKFHLTDDTEWRKVIAEAGKRKRDQRDGKGKAKDEDKRAKNVGAKGKGNKREKTANGASNQKNKRSAAKSSADKNKSPTKNASLNVVESDETKVCEPKEKKKAEKKQKVSPRPESERSTSPVPAKVTTEDSFFITSSGASYQSTAVVDRVQPDGPDDGFDRKERRANKFGRAVNKSNNNKSAAGKRQDAPVTGEHPSWIAKRKQKAIPDFQGKKVKFGGGDVNTKPAAENNVHPSWAAKQKLKPVISEFKGSKITFD